MPGPALPWQVKAFAGGGEGRMPAYKAAMAAGAAGVAYWWWSSQKELEQKQEAAVARVGAHGEKAEYAAHGGQSFKSSDSSHFPGLPSVQTNASGGHSGGAKTP